MHENRWQGFSTAELLMQIELRPVDYLPAPPPTDVVESYGIAVVGCRSVDQGAHLPAYSGFG